MRSKRAKALENDLAQVARLVDRIDRNVERIELATLVREPDTPLSADAYDGLRKQVIAATGARNAHLHQLVQFDVALRAGASADDLRALVAEWFGQASVQIVDDASVEQAFEFVGDGDGDGAARVVDPAYVDGQTGRVIKAGLAERVADEKEEVEA